MVIPNKMKYYYQTNSPFLIQLNVNSNSSYTIIEVRTSNIIEGVIESNILESIKRLVKYVYQIDIDEKNLIVIDDIEDKEFQNNLKYIKPNIILPVKPYNSRYFLDETNSEIIILSIINNKWVFYNPISNQQFSLLDISERSFQEKIIEDILPIITFPQIIIPHSFGKIYSTNEFIEKYKQYLQPINLLNPNRIYLKNDIIEVISSNFGLHCDFNYFNTNIRKLNIPESSLLPSANVISLLDVISKDLAPIFNLFNFLRSYVDLYHDILYFGHTYCEKILQEFQSTFFVKNPKLRPLFDKYISLIKTNPTTKIFTSNGNINQTKCKQIVELMVDDLIEYLHSNNITFIQKKKENSSIFSASLDNPIEMAQLYDILLKDGVNGFYVESANSAIGTNLINAGFNLFDFTIGVWDAGSGFTGSGKLKNKITAIGPPYLPNINLNLFDLFSINVSDDNKKLICSNLFSIPGPTKLSVNRIMTTTGDGIIRGESDINVQPLNTVPQINNKSKMNQKSGLVSLKTWTDLIQIVSVSKTMTPQPKSNPLKILTVIYDGLCETTARMFGLGHVLKTEGKIVTYYNYNINSRTLTKEQQIKKLQLQEFILRNNELLKDYIQEWFKQKISCLEFIRDRFFDPVLFFVSKLFIDKYNIALNKSLQLLDTVNSIDIRTLPDSLNDYIESITNSAGLLGSFFDYITLFNSAIDNILLLRPRSPIDVFLEAYDSVQQQIVNTFGDSSELELRAMIATTFAYVFISREQHDQFFTALDTIKSEIAKSYNFKSKLFVERKFKEKGGRIKFNDNKLMEYIKFVSELEDSDVSKRLLNIADIEIACQILLSMPSLSERNNNGSEINYKYFILEIEERPFLNKLPSQYSFFNTVKFVESKIQELKNVGYYKGGYRNKRTIRNMKFKSNKIYKTFKNKK